MSRSFKSTSVRGTPQSVALSQAQAIAAQQMSLASPLNGASLSLGGTGFRTGSAASTLGGGFTSTATGRTMARPLSATTGRTSSLTRTAPRRPAAHGARGSAAPSGANDLVDLSAFTGAGALSTTGGVGIGADLSGMNNTLATEPTPALENEYIVNLQQQVYFLELELNLLKKAGGGGGSMNPAGLRGSGAPTGNGDASMTDANVPDAPLDDVMLSLREKYVKMEAEYKKDMEDLKQENAELRSRARMRELEINNLKNLHGNLSQETQSWKATAQDHQSTLLDHQLANEQMILKLTQRLQKREKKLEKALDDLVNLKAEFKVAQENYATERESYTQKWNEREKKMDELNEAYLREKETNLEWEEKFRQSLEAKLNARVQELEQQQLAMESTVKKYQLTKEQAEKNMRDAQEAVERILEENEGLRAGILAMENEKKAQLEKEERDRKSKIFWSTEVANMQSQIGALTDKLNKVGAKYADSKHTKKQLKDELIQSRVYLDELTHRLTEEQDTHAKTRTSEEELNELTRELKRDLTIKTEELQTLMAKYKDMKEDFDDTQQERDRLHVQLTELQSKFDVHEALQQLKLHEFVSFAHSNLKVAGKVENLISKLKKVETIAKKVSGDHNHKQRIESKRCSSLRTDRLRHRDICLHVGAVLFFVFVFFVCF